MKKIFCLILLAMLCLSLFSCNSKESEYTITFYNNKGIYFRTNTSRGEVMYINYQDTSVYIAEKFSGEFPSEPTPPTNAGYVFLGWYQNPECTDKFLFGHYEINSDINLYAKWGKSN